MENPFVAVPDSDLLDWWNGLDSSGRIFRLRTLHSVAHQITRSLRTKRSTIVELTIGGILKHAIELSSRSVTLPLEQLSDKEVFSRLGVIHSHSMGDGPSQPSTHHSSSEE